MAYLKNVLGNDKLVHYTQAKGNKRYEGVFDYVTKRNLDTYDSFKFYNDYYIELATA